MQEVYRLLIINPGSTSTKIAIYDNEKVVFEEVLRHSNKEISSYKTIMDQYSFRKELILEELNKKEINITKLSAVVGRGGLVKPLPGGTYEVNEAMLRDLKKGVMGQHASNLGGVLAYEIANQLNISAFIVDPVVVDELEDVARVSGLEEIERVSIFHALNQKAIGRKAAEKLSKKYNEINLIVAHLGGGISVGAHKNGRVIDVNNGLNGGGPFSPERTGTLPTGALIELCYSGKYTLEEMRKKNVGKGGLVSYLGTNDGREVSQMIKQGNKKAQLIYKAMAYQVAKEIGAVSTVLRGEIDTIVLTGGLVYDKQFVQWIYKSVEFLCENILVYPGEDEMIALAQGGLRVLRGEEQVLQYQ